MQFSFKENREFETIDEDVASLEEKILQVARGIEDNASDFIQLQALMVEKETLELELDELMARWVYLNDLNDRINAEAAGSS